MRKSKNQKKKKKALDIVDIVNIVAAAGTRYALRLTLTLAAPAAIKVREEVTASVLVSVSRSIAA